MAEERDQEAGGGESEGMFGPGETIAASASSWRLVPSVKHMRGHVLVGLQEALRARAPSLYARYRDIAVDIGAEAILSVSASAWLDIALVIKSDRVLTELELADDELMAIGAEVGERSFSVIMSTMMRLSSHLGADAVTALRLSPRILPRVLKGGGVGVFRVARQTIRYEMWNHPLATSRVNRAVTCGSLQATLRKVSPATTVVEAGVRQSPPSFALRIQY
jgi:hypothetical protein